MMCEGRYPVPATSPPRDEPFEVTYRCRWPAGHPGPCRPFNQGVEVQDMTDDESKVFVVIQGLQVQLLQIQELKASPDSTLDKRALAIAVTELETSMLWLANARP